MPLKTSQLLNSSKVGSIDVCVFRFVQREGELLDFAVHLRWGLLGFVMTGSRVDVTVAGDAF